MEFQYFGGNCVVINSKEARVVVDDTLASLGAKSVLKPGDVALFTSAHTKVLPATKLVVDRPGEYEVANISIAGIPAQAHVDEKGQHTATMYKVDIGNVTVLFTGHVYPEMSEDQLEAIGKVDVMVVPVGGNGYTLDGTGALQLIKEIEPKVIIPTHYDDKTLNYEVPQQTLEQAISGLGMELKEKVTRLKVKANEISETTQLVVLERS